MPVLTVVAGPNGSGNSSLAEWLDGDKLLPDPDAIARQMSLPGVKPVALAAGREVLKRRSEYLAAGLSFTVETTLAGMGSLELMRAGVMPAALRICRKRCAWQIRPRFSTFPAHTRN